MDHLCSEEAESSCQKQVGGSGGYYIFSIQKLLGRRLWGKHYC